MRVRGRVRSMLEDVDLGTALGEGLIGIVEYQEDGDGR